MNGDRIVTASLYRDLNAFLNTIIASCSECLLPRERCATCDLRLARGLHDRLCLARDANGGTVQNDVSQSMSVRRCALVCTALLNAHGPIMAAEIDMAGIGNASNRKHTLRALWRRRIVQISKDPLGKNVYSIIPGKERVAASIAKFYR